MTVPGDPGAPGAEPVHADDLARYVGALREAGLDVPIDAVATFAAALGQVDATDVQQVLWASRATLVRRREDLAIHDATFARYFLGAGAQASPAASLVRPVVVDADTDVDDPAPGPQTDERRDDATERAVRFTAHETLRERDFATCTPAELAELARAVDRLRWHHRPVRGRRRRPGRRGALDLRRTVAATVRAGGEPVAWRRNRRVDRPRRQVLLLDVSGSMEPYTRLLLRYAHASVRARARVEVFALATRCTRLTRELATVQPDAALAAASHAVRDWDGGTRLGEDLASFLDEWGQRGVARGADVVIVSDGWDRGDPAHLAEQMARLSRAAARIVWVNPLRGTPGYEPLARGMAAALPYCDRFVDGHSLAALEQLAELLGET